MDRFLKKPRLSNSSDEEISTGLNSSRISETGIQSKPGKVRDYNDSYLAMGFSWTGDIRCPLPECIVCGEKLSNSSMAPAKLKRHFATKHIDLAHKNCGDFKRLREEQRLQTSRFQTHFKVSDKAQEASYLVAELVAKEMKAHTIAESLILPACQVIVRTMLGSEAEGVINKIPLSDNTISRRISDMSNDIEANVIDKLKCREFALQADESTDISGKAQLLAFIRFVDDGEIIEQFFCCKELPETTKGQDIFETLNSYLESWNLSWDTCVGVCTDGAPSMTGSLKGFISLVKRKNPSVVTSHCVLHREALIAKTIGVDLKIVLDQVIKMVNFIRQRPLKSRIFAKLCKSMDSAHISLLYYTEVRWLSRGNVLSRVYELKEEMLLFFGQENLIDFSNLLCDQSWCSKLAYLADIFQLLNKFNTNMQGRTENVLSSTDKLCALKHKLGIWKARALEGNLEMFPLVEQRKWKEILPLILDHLTTLQERIDHYFPELIVDDYDWIRNPFTKEPSSVGQLSLREEEELTELFHDRTLKLKHSDVSLDSFWINIENEYPNIVKKALKIMLLFSTTYICEQAFSAMTTIKNTKRERLLSVEEEMRVCLSTIRPRINEICRYHQAQVSHGKKY